MINANKVPRCVSYKRKKNFYFIVCLLLLLTISIFCVENNNQTNVFASDLNQTNETLSQTAPQTIDELRNASDDQLDFWAEKLTSYDGRNYDIVTPTRNQGQRNICWAFATIGAVESNILRKGIDKTATKNNLDFDERVLAYARFNRDGLHDPLYLTTEDAGLAGMWNSGDVGYNAYDTMTEGYALVEQNAYLAENDLDAANGELMQSKYYVQNYFQIAKETNEIKRAILKYGAVSFSYAAPTRYESKYYSGSANTNHESLIVGWDDNINRSGFSPRIPTNNGAWIVKNSWGSYGSNNLNGVSCFYMSYEEPFHHPYVVDMAMRENYQNIYHYDGQISLSKTSANAEKQAAIYEAKLTTSTKQEQLTAATIYTDLNNIDVKVEVYRNLTTNPGNVNDEANNPEQGLVVESKIIHIDVSGYHTIDFDNPVNLQQGEYFSIVISSEDANNKPVASCISDRSSVNDMTYFYENGQWQSYKKSDNYADTSNYGYVARIRAITNVVDRGEDLGKNLENARIEIEDRLVFYEKGKDLIPDIEVYFDEELLEQDVDYELAVWNNTSIGKATITISGIGEYSGTRTTYFEVAKGKYPPGRMSGTVIVYNNITMLHDIPIPSGWRWIDGERELKIGRSEYPVSLIYEGPDADFYQNLYCGFYVEKIDENPPEKIDISQANVEILGKYIYTGEEIEPRVIVTYQGKELSNHKDYELTFQKNTAAGYATVIVKGCGNYINQTSQTFKIRKARWPEEKPKSTMIVDKDIENSNQINLGPNWSWQKNYEITSDKTQAIAIYNGIDKKNYGNIKMMVTIIRQIEPEQKDISLITLNLEEDLFVYDGLKKEPNVIAIDGEYNLLKDIDFEVEYQENINAGIASAIVRGKSKYIGTRIIYFTINRANIEGFEVSQQGWTFGETAPEPTIRGQVEAAKVTYTYSDEQDGIYTENKPTKAGNYWIKAVVEQSQNYNSAEAKTTFTIKKADHPEPMPSTEMMVGRKIETLESVLLIDGWTWENPSTKISAESMTACAVYCDKENYEHYTIQITLTKEPRKEVSQLSVNIEVEPFVYDGKEKTPKIIAKDGEMTLTLGVDYDVRYENNKFAGQGKVIVTFKNDYVGTKEFDFTISQAEKPSVNTTIYHNKKAIKLSEISLPDGFIWENEDMEIREDKITAKAIYTGEDASSYKTTEFIFEIIIEEQPNLSNTSNQGSLIWLAMVVPTAALLFGGIVFFIVRYRKKQ